MKIPKIIHQIHTKGIHFLSEEDKKARALLQKNNPDWECRFYDYNDMLNFIKNHYSSRYLNAFLKINPLYGAAQTDYFRYLLLYRLGGAYFDLKSFTICSLNDILLEGDELLVFEWQGGAVEYEEFGKHKQIKRGKEYQQWNIISSPNNQYLANVIEKVTENLENYTFIKFGYGWDGVLNTTGPIPYTNAIDEVTDKHGLRCLGSSCQNGIIYRDNSAPRRLDRTHYSRQNKPIINSDSFFKKVEVALLLILFKCLSFLKRYLKKMIY
ncbi:MULTISPECIES: glycosyltransferase family 32 protein [unclassified Acinetobacter]|uniref:glycosyltransferase family 32 protein n=1 Tax=unclassified Acinetobacter TaxID=196816 RepID=UPI001C23E083|nr:MULTISPECIES: glycosyltransferase [unclassified Acinetobacter]